MYSEGFHPMPRIIFATALPVGMESMDEVVDIEIVDRVKPLEIMERLNRTLPEGIRITEATEVPLSKSPSFLVQRSVYWIMLDHLVSKAEANARIKEALKKESLMLVQERKERKRSIDIKPLIEKMAVLTFADKEGVSGHSPFGEKAKEKEVNDWGIELVLRRSDGGTAKPSEILGAILGLDRESAGRCKVIKME
jgi:radical SAM-linked protein